MAITSVGYDGTVDEAQWAAMVSKVGGYEYGIDGAGHFAVSQVAGTRMIGVAPGLAWGRGVMDISDAASVIQLDPVSSGSRWDLIALRRTWGPVNGGPTELVVIKGTSSKQIPAGRQKDPGVADDQPLALARVQAGSSSIPEIVDLRVWGRNGGQLYARHDLVRSYIDSVGTEINVNGTLWQRIVGANSVAAWQKSGTINESGWTTTKSGFKSGWTGKDSFMVYRVRNGLCHFRVEFERSGKAIAVPGNGNITNEVVAIAPSPARPVDGWMPLSAGGTGPIVSGTISPNGEVKFAAVSSGESIVAGRKYQLAGMYFVDK
ncbi:hypothetical protein [Glutamicibacter creatinolyticus]|uniref:hypothetical protein n=1 Tax=Glutamicibacter creatinolyticus TaxID=162496 RepID=UPI003217395B